MTNLIHIMQGIVVPSGTLALVSLFLAAVFDRKLPHSEKNPPYAFFAWVCRAMFVATFFTIATYYYRLRAEILPAAPTEEAYQAGTITLLVYLCWYVVAIFAGVLMLKHQLNRLNVREEQVEERKEMRRRDARGV